MTLRDVAHAAGTSTAVVSYVLNDGPRPVAPATRERVLAAAAELGYRTNRLARALRAQTSGLVAVVLADAANPYFSALARHLEVVLDGYDKLMLTGNAGYDAARQRRLVERFTDAQVDGLVVVSSDGAKDVAAEAQAVGIPAVYVHNRPSGARTPHVPADNDGAVRQAVRHLRDHGHRDIALLAGNDDAGPVGVRHKAWRGMVPKGELFRCAFSRAEAAALTRRWRAERRTPSALITATDEQAIGVLSAADGTEAPAVISLDGTPDSAYTAPPLTVTRQPLRAMAHHAVAELFDTDRPGGPLNAELVVRRSCGCERD